MNVCPLPELVVDGFSPDQIWEELQLQNVPLLQHLEESTKELAHHKRLHLLQDDQEKKKKKKKAKKGSKQADDDADADGDASSSKQMQSQKKTKKQSAEEEDDDVDRAIMELQAKSMQIGYYV